MLWQSPCCTFEVADTTVGRQKLPQTEMARGHRLMWFPVSLHQYTMCADTTHAVESVTLRAHGLPHMRDLMGVAPWPVRRGGLRYLPHSQGTLAFTVSTGAHVYLSRRDWDMTSLDTPCLAVLGTCGACRVARRVRLPTHQRLLAS